MERSRDRKRKAALCSFAISFAIFAVKSFYRKVRKGFAKSAKATTPEIPMLQETADYTWRVPELAVPQPSPLRSCAT
jgi:hypothetical protein